MMTANSASVSLLTRICLSEILSRRFVQAVDELETRLAVVYDSCAAALALRYLTSIISFLDRAVNYLG